VYNTGTLCSQHIPQVRLFTFSFSEILKERQQVTQSKSVSELSQMKSISDFPIPTTIENLIQQAKSLKESKQEET
jgi:hypothetical protein